MIKYNDDNIFVGQIKELLKSFNLPMCKVKKDDSKFYVGEYYIDKDLGGIYKVDSVNLDKTLAESTLIKDYKFNDEVLNLTKHLEIRNNFYDSYTHAYLGNYLRFLRDYFDLDLMCMYNCFTNESPTNMNIDVYDKVIANGDCFEINSNNPNYNIFMIPVKPETKYTLAFEYLGSFATFFGFYSKNHYLMPGDIPSESSSLEANTLTFHDSGIRFNSPMIIETPELSSDEQLKQASNLKLFIILPNTFTDNIVLLEGDYLKDVELLITDKGKLLGNSFFEYIPEGFEIVGETWRFNGEDTNKLKTLNISDCTYNKNSHKFNVVFSDGTTWTSQQYKESGNYDYITKLQLLEYATSTKYLLADRLKEYLTSNVITHIDEIVDNIKRVQILLTGYDESFKFKNYGIWTDDINKWIYKYIATHGNDGDLSFRDIYRDVLCFVDKDIESVLNTLKIEELSEQELAQMSEEERSEYFAKLDRQKRAIKVLNSLGGIYE